jgi:hypothetical protein
MRWVAVVTITALLAGCGAKYKPKEPVLDAWQRTMEYPSFVRSPGLQYIGNQPMTAAPVLPFMAFGAAFDLDLVAMTKNDDVEMVELARMTTPYGPLWMVLESEPTNGEQVMIAKVPGDIDAWMPELPLVRRNDPTMKVTDQTGPTQIDVTATYQAPDGRVVDLTFLGDPPMKPGNKRNGNTFNHSQNALLAVLDVETSSSLFKANVKFDGKGQGLRKVAGVVPGQFALVQAQGGLAVGSFVMNEGATVAWDNGYGKVDVVDPNAAPPPPPPEAVIQTAFATSIPKLQGCYAARQAEVKTLAGRMVLKFTVADGALGMAEAKNLGTGDGLLVDEALTTCLVDVLKGFSWPSVRAGAGSQELTFATPAAEGGSASMTFGLFEFVSSAAAAPEMAPAPELAPAPEMAPAAPAAPAPAAPAPAPEAPAPGAPAPAPAPGAEGGDPPDDGGDDLDDLLGDEMPGVPAVEAAPVAPPLADFTTTHAMRSGMLVTLPWQVSRQGSTVTATQTTDMRTLTYTYNVYGEALELSSITVEQYGHAVPVTAVTFSPALPDLRLRFNGKHTHKYVIDVNGQQNHAVGEVEVFWEESGPKVRVTPSSPEWTADRALLTSIVYGGNGSAQITTQRVGN